MVLTIRAERMHLVFLLLNQLSFSLLIYIYKSVKRLQVHRKYTREAT
jgi:hypothetical protein